MFQSISIRNRIIFAITAVILLITSVLLYFSSARINEMLIETEKRELQVFFNIALADLEASEKMALGLATLVSLDPDNQRLFAEENREVLAERTLPIFDAMKSKFAARQFQFHKPPAYSFFRAHKPAKFGDDLASFRKTVVQTNSTKQPLSGLEKGVAGIGVRGVVPVFYQGQHTGSVEFGMSFGQPFFDEFKQSHGVDIALYIDVKGKLKPFGSTMGENLISENQLVRDILSGKKEESFAETKLNGEPKAIYLNTAKDFSGNPIGVVEIVMDRSHNVETINDVIQLFIIVGVIVLVIGTFAAYLIGRGITNPIITTTDAMQDIAEGDGDLTKRLEVKSSDEIGRLAKAFNTYSVKVHDTVESANNVSVRLADSADNLAGITLESGKNTERQLLETEQIATAMNQMLATVQEIAKNAEDASASAHTANDATNTGKNNVENVVGTISQLAHDIEQAESTIKRLEERTTNIDSVLEVIRSIADQTNLLALNAAIEAARAGEHGRGFAVVADEVRSLASKTQESTQEIQDMIEALQKGAKEAVDAMQVSIDRSEAAVETAKIADTSLNEITMAVEEINNMNIQISTAATEQVAVSSEINQNVININDGVAHAKQSANQITSASDGLAQLASDMQKTMGQFKV